MGKSIKIPGRLESAETGNIVAGANAIKDDTRGKTQLVVNNEVEAAILSLAENKQNVLTFDQTPTEDSTNPVTSGGVYAADKLLSDAIEAILLLIPSAASSLNKLVDLATMNSSIATATASFKGTYNLVSDLHLSVDATHAQIAAALDALSLDADNNDYAFVQVPNTDTAPTEIKKTERYKFNGTNWAYEYDLNNSGFTSAQWNAINSGITALLVSKLSALPTNEALVAALATKQDSLTFDNLPTSGSNNPVKSGGVYTRNAEIVAMITDLDAAKQDVLTFDNTPMEGSSNPVKSGGVYLAISALQATIVALDGAKQDKLTFDSTPTLGSTNPVTSSGIKTELNRIDGNITTLDNLYRALTQSSLVIVQPTDTWPVANPGTTTIYRVVDRTNTPPQYYSDYMWNGSAMVLMAQYDNAIDDVPLYGSNNLVKSGGVFDEVNAITTELNGHKVVKIPVTAHQDFLYEIDTTNLKVSKLHFSFTGKSLFSNVVAVYNSVLSSPPVFNIEVDGEYDVPVTDYGKITFFRNSDYVSSSGIVTIDFDVEEEGIAAKAERLDKEADGELVKLKIPVTAGQDFRYEISNTDIENNYIDFSFEGKYLFSNVIAVYNTNSVSPFTEIADDGVYNVPFTDYGKIVFLRTSDYVTGNGYVIITYKKTRKGFDKATEGDILKLSWQGNNGNVEQGNEGIILHQDGGNVWGLLDYRNKYGSIYNYRVKARCTSGTQMVRFGLVSSVSADRRFWKELYLNNKDQVFEFTLPANSLGIAYFAILAAEAHSGVDVIISECFVSAFKPAPKVAITFNTDGFLQSVSKWDKPLVKIACEGDSLIANPVGGSIPSALDEGTTRRPMRMDTNNIPRRLYDYMSWNKPIWRRLDDSEWTKSGFSLAAWGTDYSVFMGIQVPYHTASSAGSYCEITVPQGYENFAIIVRTKSGNGALNVTINGSLPSTITHINPVLTDNPGISQATLIQKLTENTRINASVCPVNIPCGVDQIDLNKGVTTNGNPYSIVEFIGLPSGQANTIRFTEAGNNPVDIWGGFYWTGNTMVLMNIAHGGYDTSMLIENNLEDELYSAGYDAVLFEVTEMNNMRLSLEQTKDDLSSIISKLDAIGIDRCFTSCNILGSSIEYDCNFYIQNAELISFDKTQEEINNVVKDVLSSQGQPFVDLFQYFKWHTENRGGTLEGGDAGLFYSWDGQHPNIEGCRIWVDGLKKIIENTPIMLD